MNKFLIATAALVLATPTYANEAATDVRVFDHTKTITNNAPVVTTECRNVEVPIYGQTQGGGATGGDVLGGMIIGGLLGKGLTGDDNGAAAGAVMGGVIAADRNRPREVITGYRQERQCTDRVVNQYQTKEVYSHSTIRFTVNGLRYVVEFQRSDR